MRMEVGDAMRRALACNDCRRLALARFEEARVEVQAQRGRRYELMLAVAGALASLMEHEARHSREPERLLDEGLRYDRLAAQQRDAPGAANT